MPWIAGSCQGSDGVRSRWTEAGYQDPSQAPGEGKRSMHRRSLLIAAATVSLAIGALAAPAAAADPRVAFLNGIAGKTVDVCVGNNEVKSRLKYGKNAVRV